MTNNEEMLTTEDLTLNENTAENMTEEATDQNAEIVTAAADNSAEGATENNLDKSNSEISLKTEAAAKPKKTKKSKKKSSSETDVDFENFSLDEETTQKLHDKITPLSESTFLKKVKILCKEKGEKINEKFDLGSSFSSNSKNSQLFRFKLEDPEREANYSVEVSHLDLVIRKNKKNILEASELPKNSQFLIKYCENDFLDSNPVLVQTAADYKSTNTQRFEKIKKSKAPKV